MWIRHTFGQLQNGPRCSEMIDDFSDTMKIGSSTLNPLEKAVCKCCLLFSLYCYYFVGLGISMSNHVSLYLPPFLRKVYEHFALHNCHVSLNNCQIYVNE